MQGYRNSQEHLFAELQRLDVLLNIHIMRQQRDPMYTNFNEFRGLFISKEEIDLLVGKNQQKPTDEPDKDALEVQTLFSTITQLQDQITQKIVTAIKDGVHLSLVRLAQCFHLTVFDVDAILICLAPELDLKYEKLYAYLQNDVTRKKPSVDLILNLCCHSLAEKLQARIRLLAEAPLRKYHLLTYPNDGHNAHLSLLSRSVKIDDRILHYLLDVDTLDEPLRPFTSVILPRASLADLLLPPIFKERLARLFHAQLHLPEGTAQREALVFLFHGPAGVGKKYTAEALCQSVGRKLLIADLAQILSNGSVNGVWTSRLFREARLQSAAVYLDHAELLLAENEKAGYVLSMLRKAWEDIPGIVFLGSAQPWDVHTQTTGWCKVEFPAPDYTLRERLWEQLVHAEGYTLSQEVRLGDLADKFHFTAGQIRHTLLEAGHLAQMHPHDAAITVDDLYQACRAQSSLKLTTLARKITPIYTWEDIVLPKDRLEHLKEICSHSKYRQQVFSQWGFSHKMSLGKGLSILFVGPSGTGKTMAAEIMATELGLDLYKIDLSCIVSKYIGETEKNLSKIFQEAEQSNVILFFDEADAIFGKRSEVKDSHDRYANIEINYLLQKMEEHEGMVILASNFQKNIDDAFTRRLRFIVEFPFPDEGYRHRIWQRIFPANTSLSPDIDFDFLSRKLKITGGNIRNIALNAAFLAAAHSGVIGMEHLIRSTKREFQKMGRLCVKADFEQYFSWVEDER